MDVMIRGLGKATVKELKKRAKEHNRSLEAEVRAIFEEIAERGASKDRREAIQGQS